MPTSYLLAAAAERLAAFLQAGGRLLVTFFSGIVNEHERVGLGDYPALLRDLLGIWVEE